MIPNGVDPGVWRPASVAPSPELPALRQRFAGRRVFLYMGRVATEKNVEALLRAWRLVRPEGCVLLIVGDGPLQASLQGSAAENDVIWWGFEPSLERRLALQQLAEVFLLPSLVEGLSLALLEAMASGTACVATDAGADGEVLEGGAGIVISTQGSPPSCAPCCRCCGTSRCSPPSWAAGPASGCWSATPWSATSTASKPSTPTSATIRSWPDQQGRIQRPGSLPERPQAQVCRLELPGEPENPSRKKSKFVPGQNIQPATSELPRGISLKLKALDET